ncbi:hypothetical protein LWI29_004382 [Acer saccharum]|uniref:Uncharacterized protein n=1 Tax=Acer saccharum TaxID=4024 RepID=A0AA39TNB3_ACESA|nr:hypothetical protein LWI29_004382 [Acer saccharum]
MEKQKTKFVSSFEGRVGASFEGRVGAQKLEEFKTYLRNQKELISNHYSVTLNLPIEKFFSIILRDSVFIVELLIRCTIGSPGFLLTNDQLRNQFLYHRNGRSGASVQKVRKLDKCFGFSTDELPHDSLVQLVDGCREHTRKLVEKNIIVALNTLKSRTRAAYAHCYPALMLFI